MSAVDPGSIRGEASDGPGDVVVRHSVAPPAPVALSSWDAAGPPHRRTSQPAPYGGEWTAARLPRSGGSSGPTLGLAARAACRKAGVQAVGRPPARADV